MVNAQNATDRRKRRWLIALILINVALTPLSFIPTDSGVSTAIRILAFLAVLGALTLAGATLNLPRMTGWKRGIAVGVPLVAAVVAGAIAFGYITSASTSDAVEDDAFQIDMLTDSSPTIPVSRIVVSPSDATSAAAIESAADIAGALSVIEGAAAQELVAAAQNSNYTSRRGGTLDWEGAIVERSTTMRLVTIPFVGTDFPEIDKIVFMLAAHNATVVEFSTQIVDESTVNFRMWQNGAAPPLRMEWV